MNNNPSIFRDLKDILFSSTQFFADRFFKIDSRRIFILGYCGVLIGYLIGSLVNLGFSELVIQEYTNNAAQFAPILEKLGLTEQAFLDLLNTQRAYNILLAVFSPIIAYFSIHLLGGALFVFLWLMIRSQTPLTYSRVIECASLALTALIFNVIPIIGPFIGAIMLVIIASRALTAQYQMVGFMKIMSILSALYVCFFMSSATLQLLAPPLAKALGW